MQVIKQFCEYRTGSNVLKVLIEKYLTGCIIYANKFGHKHSFFNENKWDEDGGSSKVGLLISIKHPFSWIVSRARWSALDDFKFVPSGLTIKDIDDDTLVKWCEGYNNKYLHWFSLPFQKYIVKYEKLIQTTYDELENIRTLWGLDINPKEDIWNPRLESKVVNPGQKIMDSNFDFSYYLEHRYLDELTESQKKIIIQVINWDALKYRYDSI